MRIPSASRTFLTAVVLAAFLLVGCSKSQPPVEPQPPSPPVSPNACLSTDFKHELDKSVASNPNVAIVVATVRSADDFAVRGDGRWDTHWYLVKLDVVTVEKGPWSDKNISFVYKDQWPDPRSGIRVDMVFPYRVGATFAFALDTSTKPATILAQKFRSPTPRPVK